MKEPLRLLLLNLTLRILEVNLTLMTLEIRVIIYLCVELLVDLFQLFLQFLVVPEESFGFVGLGDKEFLFVEKLLFVLHEISSEV